MNKCKTCKYYDRTDDRGMGGCHRYPPTLVTENNEVECCIPDVTDTDWCGEWKGKEIPMGDSGPYGDTL